MGWFEWSDDDDAIYDDDYYADDDILGDHDPTPDTLLIKGAVRAASRRGAIGVEWWGRQWVAAFERRGDRGRLQRGKRYARNGSVRDLQIDRGRAFARVSGSRFTPYRTAVTLKTFTDEEWSRALAALADQAIYSAKLLAGEMPADIEDMFQSVGLSLFPGKRGDLVFHCSCPDWGDPCKHAAAIYYLLAEQFDADPFTLFHLRGRTRGEVLARLRAYRGVAAAPEEPEAGETAPSAPPLDADLEAFWQPGGEINVIRSAPSIPRGYPLLNKLGNPPGDMKDELRKIYKTVAKEALDWLGSDR